jgi:hypothetical protein
MNDCKIKSKQQLDDNLETATEKCYAGDDLAQKGELWYKRKGYGNWVLKVCRG